MAKKGGVQQLQADLQNDVDFKKFLERPGLLVLDVYSEWCGPCLGMVGGLRKIKLEMGGDNLQLAICKSDTITALRRFHKRSEPTWLFVTGGRAVNIMFGTDVPKLMALLNKELEKTLQKAPRTVTYAVNELQPIEVEQLRVKTEIAERVQRIEREAKLKKQTDYLTFVTDAILANLPDIGVTVFGPHVNRDMFKKLQEPAEALKMQCKDRKVIQVTAEQFESVNFACKNPLPPDVIEQLDGKELLMCFWKIDEGAGPVPNVLTAYAKELTKERVAPPNEEFNKEHPIPPIIAPMKIKFEVELAEGEEWVEEISSEEEAKKNKHAKIKSIINVQQEAPAADDNADLDGEEEGSEEETPEQDVRQSLANLGIDLALDLDFNDQVEEEEEVVEEVIVKPKFRTKTVKMPPIWVPNNRRTHAALVYMFFRNQTTGFLPPDPTPEPPHVIMAFEASKRQEIMNAVERQRSDVPSYGYFTTDDPAEATLLASSTDRYNKSVEQSPSDMIVLKVSKVQSNMMLSLVVFAPTYVSPNVTAGREEALKFFPEDYKQQPEVPEKEEEDKTKKKKKSKKTEDTRESHDVPEPSPEKVEAAAPPPPPQAEAPPPEAQAPAGEAPAPAAPPAEGEAAPAEGGTAAAAPADGAAPTEAAEEAPPPAAEEDPQAPTEGTTPAPATEAAPEDAAAE
ncbi:fibrous sheath CABYR-binding protein isoform X2 [Drosophila subobscura]|uniref:fibrous sheath CABYR-binding protein isoform X2 n=1 Tax=Drosophila subobscura TaxID=7241 RepID=UPI00155A6DB7|nr:fibrous sheath CABYR-binding protein isoform X2 [Drosophila subobscura]